MKHIKRLILPLVLFGGLALSSCSLDLAYNFTKDDLDINVPWEDFNIPVSEVVFDASERNISINKGETHQYQFEVFPENASAKTLNWHSDNESVATVSDSGLLTAVAGGNANITVSNDSNSFAPVTLGVNVVVPVTSFNATLDVSKNSSNQYELDWNKEYEFAVAYEPSDTTQKDLIWTIPEAEQAYASVNDGVVTTSAENGTVHLNVKSPYLSDFEQNIELEVKDRKIHVSSIALALAQGEANRIEIGEYTTVVGTVDPANAQDAADMKYYSRNPNIATVDPSTGVVTAVAEGTAQIFANCEGVDSNDVEIEVYEVYATSLSIVKDHDIIVTNQENGSAQLQVNIGLSESGKTRPTFATPTYVSSDPEVVSVSETGLLTSLKSGVVTVTVSINGQGDNVFTDTVQVTSKAYVTSIVITGPVSAYFDETATLAATISPAVVEDDEIQWEVNPANKVTTDINGNSITLTPLGIEGPVTVRATNPETGVVGTHTVSFSERKVEFEVGEVYLVGDKQFNTGESVVGMSSWTAAKYALKLTAASSDDPNVSRQVTCRVTLHAGDQIKLREGPTDGGWKDLFYYGDDGVKVWNYEQAGAIDGIHLRAASSPSGNIDVLKDGTYDIYYKDLVSGGFNIYIGFAPVIHFDKASFSIGQTATTTIYLHNYVAPVQVVSSNTDVARILSTTETPSSGLAVEVNGWSAGTATITATDANGHVAEAHVTVRSDTGGVMTPIYLNANGIFDTDGAVPFIHAYGDETNHSDIKMTLVSGQTMIYVAEISATYENVIFVRMPSGSTALDWETSWNQSRDTDAAYGDNNMFTITGFESVEGQSKDYLTGTWGTFDPEVVYTLPADYTLVGSFNSWTVGDQNYALTKVESGHYRITGVELAQGDAVKVVDKTGEHWFANATEYENCGYTLVPDGYGGSNMSLNEAGTYKIDFYEVDVYGTDNHIVFTKDSGGGDDPTYLHTYYVVGSINSWTVSETYGMSQDEDVPTHYYINHVTLAVGDEIKVNGPANNSWFGVASIYEGCHYTVGEGEDHDGNLIVSEAGTYTIDFYTNASNGNYISLYDESTPPAPSISYYLKGTFTNPTWDESDDYLFTVSASDSNKFELKDIELTAGDELKVNAPSIEGEAGWFSNNHTYTNCGFTINEGGNVVVNATGTYDIDFYVSSSDGNHIVLTKQGGSTPEPTTYTYTITNLPNWIRNDGCVIFVWAWSPSDGGSWHELTFSQDGTSATFTVEEELTGFLAVRCYAGTTTPNWQTTGNQVGRIYNKTADINCTAGTFSYACSSWSEYNPS